MPTVICFGSGVINLGSEKREIPGAVCFRFFSTLASDFIIFWKLVQIGRLFFMSNLSISDSSPIDLFFEFEYKKDSEAFLSEIIIQTSFLFLNLEIFCRKFVIIKSNYLNLLFVLSVFYLF